MQEKELLKEFGPMGYVFKWVERHKTLTDIILWLEILALGWVVFTYNFTTNF